MRDLGVLDGEAIRYPELYDELARTLSQLGRPPIVHNGERRFLASFLREGGLPAFIGDIAALVVARATEAGWDGLQDESTRTWVVERVQQTATGAAARLLGTSEGRLALADFLGAAARARAALVDAGTDLTTLSTPESVRQALENCGIDLPSVESEDLLLGVLGSFTSARASTLRSATPLRIVAVTGPANVQLLLRVELDALGLPDLLPCNIEYATLVAEACSQGRCLLARKGGAFVDKNTQQELVDFSRGGRRGPSSVEVTFAGAGGVKHVTSVGLLVWPEANALWFDVKGEMLVEERGFLQPGEVFTVVVWDDRTMTQGGSVDVRELAPPVGAARAYRIEVRGAGTLSIEGGGAPRSIVAHEQALDVAVANVRTTELSAVGGFVSALPDLILPVGVEADVYVREVGGGTERQVRSGARGRVFLTADRWVRDLIGSVRVNVSSRDGGKWSALWRVLPRGLEVTSRGGTVRIRGAGSSVVRAEPGRVERTGEDLLVTPPPGVEQITLLIMCPGGEALHLRVVVSQTPVRLREGGENGLMLPLDGSTKLTERQVFAGAYLELAKEGAMLTVATKRGEVLLRMIQNSARVARLPLLDLARHVQRVGESPTTFTISVGDSASYSFGLSVPRLAHPHARPVDGTVEFDYLLDPLDLPHRPALALFPVRPAIARSAIVECDFERATGNQWVARLRPEYAPTVQGRYIAFLVDTKTAPPRPMSGARAISIPLSLEELPCPEDVSGLDRALWTRTELLTEAALNELVGRPELPGFLAALSQSVHERAPYGLDWFHLFGTIATRCQWVLLASLRYVPEAERDAWLALWPQQIKGFTWHRFLRSDAELLALALPNRSEAETMALIERAKAAFPMPQSVEFLLQVAAAPAASPLQSSTRARSPLAKPPSPSARSARPARAAHPAPTTAPRASRRTSLRSRESRVHRRSRVHVRAADRGARGEGNHQRHQRSARWAKPCTTDSPFATTRAGQSAHLDRLDPNSPPHRSACGRLRRGADCDRARRAMGDALARASSHPRSEKRSVPPHRRRRARDRTDRADWVQSDGDVPARERRRAAPCRGEADGRGCSSEGEAADGRSRDEGFIERAGRRGRAAVLELEPRGHEGRRGATLT